MKDRRRPGFGIFTIVSLHFLINVDFGILYNLAALFFDISPLLILVTASCKSCREYAGGAIVREKLIDCIHEICGHHLGGSLFSERGVMN